MTVMFSQLSIVFSSCGLNDHDQYISWKRQFTQFFYDAGILERRVKMFRVSSASE